MKEVLNKLFLHKTLSKAEAKDILIRISNAEFNEALMTAFITCFKLRPIHVDELEGFKDALIELKKPIDLRGIDAIDVCGTGGDKKNTFNISTLSAFVIAGAGYKVAKHGNYSVSSKCGSSNVLEYLGYVFTDEEDKLLKQIDEANLCFFHAPLFHPTMKAVGPIRRQLGMVTFFNMLGPLVNPAEPPKQLAGVFNMELARLYQYVFQNSGKDYAIIHGLDGYDEVSLTGPFSVKASTYERIYDPGDINMPRLNPTDLQGGETVEEAAEIFTTILKGEGTIPQNSVALVNAGLAIQCFKPEIALEACIEEAKSSLESGRALQVLKKLTR